MKLDCASTPHEIAVFLFKVFISYLLQGFYDLRAFHSKVCQGPDSKTGDERQGGVRQGHTL